MDKKVENKTISNDGTKTTLPSNINTNYKSSVPLDSHTYVVKPNDPVMAEGLKPILVSQIQPLKL